MTINLESYYLKLCESIVCPRISWIGVLQVVDSGGCRPNFLSPAWVYDSFDTEA